MGGVTFRFANFASQFIRVQIFQIDFSTLPLILSVSKYFRYICGGRNEHLLIPLFRIISSNYELLTFLIFPLKKLKGRVEPSYMLQIFDPSDRCTDICKTLFPTFKLQFHHEVGLIQQRYFELFFSAWSIFSYYKRSAPNETDFNIFVHLL